MSQARKTQVAEFLRRVLSNGEVDAAGEFFHTDMVEEVPFPGQGPGLAGLQQTVIALRTAFPDMHWRVDEQIAEDQRVLTRFTWTGTHNGPFMGMPPSGRAVSVWGMVIDQFEGNKVQSTRILMDTLGLMQQLNPAPANAA